MNNYLRDRAMRRDMQMRDGRNPYGSRGGYVSSRRGRRGGMRDREMADYNYGSERDRGYDSRYGRGGRNQDGHYPYEQYGEHHRPMDFEMYGYGIGGIRPMDYARGGMDYGYDYGYDYGSEDMEKEWKEHLKKWCEELKRYDRFNMPKDQIIQTARQMGVRFDNYNEEEFLTAYYMVMSDYPQVANEPHTYLSLAKDWLEDKDSKLKGAEKLSAYYYEVINAGEE